MTVLGAPYRDRHDCTHWLPDRPGHDTGLAAQCSKCRRWWLLAPSWDYGGLSVWRPVRWWHWRTRRRIRDAHR